MNFFNMRNTREREAIFLYLFMHIDGLSTKEEKERFDQICNELEIDDDFKSHLYEMGEKLRFVDSNDNSEMIISLMNAFMNGDKSFKTVITNGTSVEIELDTYVDTPYFIFRPNPKHYFNKAEQAFMIWTMVNLGYADTSYSKNEQKVVNHLVSAWEMDETIYNQIKIFAETLLSINNRKEWVVSTNKTAEEKLNVIKQCDEDIKKISRNIEIMIQEIYI